MNEVHLKGGLYFFYWHDISNNHDVPTSIRTTPKRFKDEILYIKNNFNVIGLDEAISKLKSTLDYNYSKPEAVLCFDDGFRSVLTEAKPILDKVKFPFVVFLNSAFLNQTYCSETLLSYYLDNNDKHKVTEVFGKNALKHGLWNVLKKTSCMEQLDKLQNLVGEMLVKKRYYLSWKDLELLSQDSKVVFGNHTIHHLWLANLSAEEQLYEIEESHNCLKNLSNYRNILALPFGTDDCFNLDTIPLIGRFSQGVLMKANGGINHKIENGLLVIERIALSDNKPSIDTHIRNRLYGFSARQRFINKLKNIIKKFFLLTKVQIVLNH
jgi:peptidoglycan/xylan/chitin deacetylase (PgdA/CDA1 family)